ncbi:MAG TPA: FUSC family membrane protein [Gillisia sp.]|nr:FUSC family membrane protein [Gillisia sp.]
MTSKLSSYFTGLPGFLRSTDFAKAVILGLAITLPIIIAVRVDRFEIGLALALGALLSSPSDVSGSQRHKNYGIFFSTLLAVLASLIGGYLIRDSWAGLPVLGVVMFGISYLSVFGFRASLIAFSGLFAMVLSFANISTVLELYERALLIGVGGFWYLGLTYLWQRINPKGQTDQHLAQSFRLTSKYLETRAHLLTGPEDREKYLKQLIELQSELNENHETLRSILISSRKTSGNSNYERRRLLILIQLVDMLELAMANPVNYEKMDDLMEKNREQILSYRELIFAMASRLDEFSRTIHKVGEISESSKLEDFLANVKNSLSYYITSTSVMGDEGFLMLQNLYDYQERQVEKINKIERLLSSKDLKEFRFIKKEEAARFITHQEYDPKILVENFSLKSTIFKHSLRLAVVVMAGYAIGEYFSLQNAYWILLTIIVIMRPNYGLTKTRSKERTIGTLIGAAVAIGIVLISQDLRLYAVLAVISLVLAFSMVQKNYRASAVFVTLSVVFVYALLEPNVLNVIQFRVVDTLIGAGLATAGNLLLWPSWEFFGIKSVITESLTANKEYFKEVAGFYEKKGKLPTSYKLSRKQAFLGIGNLSAAFQRMTQEPKRKQKNLDKIYEITVLNHNFLSSLASLGTYIQNHPTTKASAHFISYSDYIENNLNRCLALIDTGIIDENPVNDSQLEAKVFFDARFKKLTGRLEGDFYENIDKEELKEAQLVYEQLKWLLELSEKLEKTIKETKFV